MVGSVRKLSFLVTLVLVGCASTDPLTGTAQNQVIDVQYGTVENVRQVNLKASYGKDSLLGGALGLLAASTGSTTTQIAGAALGAGLGALIGKETAGTGQRYSIRLVSGSEIAIVTEQTNLEVGDCVSVEQGEHTNLRRVSSVMCITPASHPAYKSMNSAIMQSAGNCRKAQEDVLNAKTQEETDIALRKMRALCES
jgi:outer membrane lipoprotein SlyB